METPRAFIGTEYDEGGRFHTIVNRVARIGPREILKRRSPYKKRNKSKECLKYPGINNERIGSGVGIMMELRGWKEEELNRENGYAQG